MSHPTFATRQNLDVVEAYYQRWLADAASVDEHWRAFFHGFELGNHTDSVSAAQSNVTRLIGGYRGLGHVQAHLDPLNDPPPDDPQLSLASFGLHQSDLPKAFDGSSFLGLSNPKITLTELIGVLRRTYCRTIGFEYVHVPDLDARRWLQAQIEPRRAEPNMEREQKLRILRGLHYAELFETFLHTRFQGQKRFSLEGAETLIPLLNALVEKSQEFGVREFVFGMAHRGRLNVLANVLRKPYEHIFAEFEDYFTDDSTDGDGDVKYHLGYSNTVDVNGWPVHLSLTPNPSHLESVNPVVEGRTRAKQDNFGDAARTSGVPVVIHGDAAMPGQGQVAETINLARLDGYKTGGTVHIVVNNQVGFTTSPSDARSTRYCTDVAKLVHAPIFHVNGEDPEAVVYVAELALAYRQKFGADVVIDMVCYRRRGHNEGDEPKFTQPVMYGKVESRPTPGKVYSERLIKANVITQAESDALDTEFSAKLDAAHAELKHKPKRQRGMSKFEATWKGYTSRYSHNPMPTGVAADTLRQIAERMTAVPADFDIHPVVKRTVIDKQRAAIIEGKEQLDWGTAELMAFGSLLVEKIPVRLSGQDCRRGTFSTRHAVFRDQKTGAMYTPLSHVKDGQAGFQVWDSPLSEYAVVGFEYGYSLDMPKALVLWEAQFGDFANGAQVIIDQYIVSSESKWQRQSGLVLLLPHGYEGQGPEHSSARLERFLQSCAEDNIQVVNATTPAQYFHLLRRQVLRNFRKPLVVMSPKSLLRHPLAKSPLADLTAGSFREVLDDPRQPDPNKVRRVVLCSGKLYYDFHHDAKAKDESHRGRTVPAATALVRLEQFYPFPQEQLDAVLKRYGRAEEYVWAQEEPQNMGGWSFVEPRLRQMGYDVQYVGRDASASPATGSYKIHDREQKELVEVAEAAGGSLPHTVQANAPPPAAKTVAPDANPLTPAMSS